MMLTDIIAKMIEEMLAEEGGTLELKRNDLAERVGCVPSQINYVITSRFTPERGYVIESRRGGGGYVRITKKQLHKDEYLMHFFFAVGERLDSASATAYLRNLYGESCITKREAALMQAALSTASDDSARADMLKRMLLALMK